MIKWKDLPREVQEKMLDNQVAQGNKRSPEAFKKNIDSGGWSGFLWSRSPEGHRFWSKIIQADKVTPKTLEDFYKLYPKPDPRNYYEV